MIAAVYGGTPLSPQAKRARNANVLVATPGRLFDLIERRLVDLGAVRVLVLDEADRMLDMGFRPQVDRILTGVPENRQTMLFSATLDGPVAELARRYTSNAVRYTAAAPTEKAHGEIEHRFVPVTAETKLDQLVEHLNGDRGRALVFVRTKHGADKLARKLSRQHDVRAVVMHGNMSQNARERSLAQFESGRVPTLVATDVAARGLDVSNTFFFFFIYWLSCVLSIEIDEGKSLLWYSAQLGFDLTQGDYPSSERAIGIHLGQVSNDITARQLLVQAQRGAGNHKGADETIHMLLAMIPPAPVARPTRAGQACARRPRLGADVLQARGPRRLGLVRRGLQPGARADSRARTPPRPCANCAGCASSTRTTGSCRSWRAGSAGRRATPPAPTSRSRRRGA